MIRLLPICSMYGIFTYIWVIYGANVGKYSIHGAYGLVLNQNPVDVITFVGISRSIATAKKIEVRPIPLQ